MTRTAPIGSTVQPSALRAALQSAAEALGLAISASQTDQLLAYLGLLQRWNAVHNLSGAHDPQRLLGEHVVDCLAIVPALARHAGGRRLTVLDAGTGAGLPAIVVAIMRPEWSVTAVDAVGKKAAFVRQAAGELRLGNATARHARLEDIAPDGGFDLVVSRAFATLGAFVQTTRHLIAPGGAWAAMKGKTPETELQHLPAGCQLFHVERLSVPGLDAERCLVWMRPASANN